MGFFSKVFKGVGKVFKKIGKGIKSAFKKFGRFMGKIGILGQIAMMFILPGIGNAILGTAGTAATVAGIGGATVTAAAIPASGLLGGALGSIGVAAGKAAVWVGNKIATVKNVFSNITQGITETLGNFAKTAGKKLGFKGDMFTNAADNFFSSGTAGGDTAFSKSFGSASKFQNLTTDFSKISKMVDEDIGDPFRSTEQTLAEKIQETSLDTPRLADGSIDQFSIDPNMSIDSSISEAMKAPELNINKTEYDSFMAKPTSDAIDFKIIKGEGIADAVRAGADAAVVKADESFLGKMKTEGQKQVGKFGDKVTSGAAAKLTGTGPQATEITSYSSQPAQFTAVGIGADSMLMNTGAIQQDMSAGLQGMFGHPSAIFNDQQATEEFKQRAVGYGGGF